MLSTSNAHKKEALLLLFMLLIEEDDAQDLDDFTNITFVVLEDTGF